MLDLLDLRSKRIRQWDTLPMLQCFNDGKQLPPPQSHILLSFINNGDGYRGACVHRAFLRATLEVRRGLLQHVAPAASNIYSI